MMIEEMMMLGAINEQIKVCFQEVIVPLGGTGCDGIGSASA